MAKFSARIALFDNSARQVDNEDAPAMTGKMEVSESQIQTLIDELQSAETQTYGNRRFKVIDLSVWENDGGSSLIYSGKARMARPRKAVVDVTPEYATDGSEF